MAVYLTHMRRGRAFDLRLTLPVTLEDLYFMRRKKLVVQVMDDEGGLFKRPLVLSLLHHRDEYTFQGMGDASPWYGVKNGDIIVSLKVERHPAFYRDEVLSRFDLHVTKRLTLYDFYYGCNVYVTHLNGSTFELWYHPVGAFGSERSVDGDAFDLTDKGSGTYAAAADAANGSTTQIIPGEGLPFLADTADASNASNASNASETHARRILRGDLYVFFDVCLPTLTHLDLENPLNRMVLRKLFARGIVTGNSPPVKS